MGRLTHTVSGDVASFKNTDKTNIENLKVHFLPIQEGTGDPSPDNVRPITGWTNVKATISNEKVKIYCFSAINFTGEINNQKSNGFGTTISTNEYNAPNYGLTVTQTTWPNETTLNSYDNGYFCIGIDDSFIKKAPNCRLRIKADVSIMSNPLNSDNIGILTNGYYVAITPIVNGKINCTFDYFQGTVANRHVIELRLQGKSLLLTNIELSIANSDSNTFGIYNGVEYTVDWSSEIGTVYGGYVDLVTGELVKEYDSYTFNGSSDDNFVFLKELEYPNSLFSYYQFKTNKLDRLPKNNCNDFTYCNIAKPNIYKDRDYNVLFYIGTPINQISIYIDQTLIDPTVESLNAWFTEHPLQIVYPLANPITYQLSSVQLKTLQGANNIWSNTNDKTEVTYQFVDHLSKNALKIKQPHIIIPQADGIVSFDTNLSAPLKECKIHFSPVQEGTGDPSPDNVRPITGWTGIDVRNTGINVWDEQLITGCLNAEGGIDTAGAAHRQTTSFIPVKGGLQYRLIGPSKAGNGRVAYYDINKNSVYVDINTGLPIGIFTAMNGASYMRITLGSQYGTTYNNDVSVNYPESDNTYNAYQGAAIPIIDWSDSAGTVYGGYVDLSNGTLVATKICAEPHETNVWHITNSYVYQYAEIPACEQIDSTTFGNSICSHWKTTKYDNADLACLNMNRYMVIGKDFFNAEGVDFTDATAIATYFAEQKAQGTPFQVCSNLAEPIVYQLDPVTLKTLRGLNNVWSNTNGNVELKCWKY